MSRTIPFLDIKEQTIQIEEEVISSFREVFKTAAFSNGPVVKTFEDDFAKFCQAPYAVAVSSGTSALILAIKAIGLKLGDEVILPTNTYMATAWGVIHNGVTPIFADCLPDTWNIDPIDVRKKITSKTKAVIAVHMYGQPCDMDSLRNISSENNLVLIEDAAHAHGATLSGKLTGSLGDIACFSFYPGKNLGSFGEGGAVVTANPEWAENIRILRNQGTTNKYYFEKAGFNERMHSLQAAVLSIKLKYLDNWNKRRQQIASRYNEKITNPLIQKQYQQENCKSVYHLYVVCVENRDIFREFLIRKGIETGMHYPVPCHLQEALQHFGYNNGDFPVAEKQASECVSLPMFPELTDDEVSYVIQTVNSYISES